jgi:hypothetical protein
MRRVETRRGILLPSKYIASGMEVPLLKAKAVFPYPDGSLLTETVNE